MMCCVAPTVYLESSALRGGLLCPRRQSRQWPRPHSLAPLGQFTFPPVPLLRERVTLGFMYVPRRAKSRSVSLLLSGHWALLPSKFAIFCLLTYTASCIPTCSVRWWSGDQLPQLFQSRRCSYSADSSKFSLCRGLCPRGKKDQPVLILPAETY